MISNELYSTFKNNTSLVQSHNTFVITHGGDVIWDFNL